MISTQEDAVSNEKHSRDGEANELWEEEEDDILVDEDRDEYEDDDDDEEEEYDAEENAACSSPPPDECPAVVAHPAPPSRGRQVLRWVAACPVAVIAAVVAQIVVVLLNRITMGRYFEPGELGAEFCAQCIGGIVMGATAVYVAAAIAPHGKQYVAGIMAGFVLMVAGFILFPAVMQANFRAILSLASAGIGAGAVAYGIISGEIEAARADWKGIG
jgi:hypothetical protein